MDLENLDFPPAVLAASALYHFSCREVATQVSGYQFKDIIAVSQSSVIFETLIPFIFDKLIQQDCPTIDS